MVKDKLTVTETDARAMVRLLGKTAALSGEHNEKKRFLMRGLCQLIHADCWVWTLGCDISPGGPHTCVGFIHEGFDEDRFAKYLRMLENPQIGDTASPFFVAVAENHGVTTMRREEIDPENRTSLLPDALQALREADIGPLIMNALPLDSDSISTIVLYRRNEAPTFTPRESQIVKIILSEVPWLHMAGWPDDRGAGVPQLFPQQRVVLNLLIDGMDRKTIAASMGLTENTVAGYAKDVYRHFAVHSQPQLMRKFLTGNPAESEV
jgi:DNA-binding CsgD family transcriptional regulator